MSEWEEYCRILIKKWKSWIKSVLQNINQEWQEMKELWFKKYLAQLFVPKFLVFLQDVWTASSHVRTQLVVSSCSLACPDSPAEATSSKVLFSNMSGQSSRRNFH